MDNPFLLRRLLDLAAATSPALRRRIALAEVLAARGLTEREPLIRAVEERVGTGVFGASPHAALWGDLRALRGAGIPIGYSRLRGASGYFLRIDALPPAQAEALRNAVRDMDWDRLDLAAKATPQRRVEAVFEMSQFAREVSEAGRRK